jgi:hypothetical protein
VLSLDRGINAQRSFANIAMRELFPFTIFVWANKLE